jgi:7-cyano-7-deazaguanine synthase
MPASRTTNKEVPRAVVLLSGGLDSATTLYFARAKGYQTFCLIFDYGQRHRREIASAARIARSAQSEYKNVKISLPWGGSALTDRRMVLPKGRAIKKDVIPLTYVPARNIIFLSFAASYAEALGAQAIFIGANALDYSGYPDCRPNFYAALQQTLNRGLKAGVEGKPIRVYTPLIRKTKAQIIRLGMKLKVPYELTWSCYAGGQRPCDKCDSCRLRAKGFRQIGKDDPAR